MTQGQWTAVDKYIADLLAPVDPSLAAALRAGAAAGLPPHDVSPNLGKLLQLLARVQGRAPSWRSARWAATARSGSRGRSAPTAA